MMLQIALLRKTGAESARSFGGEKSTQCRSEFFVDFEHGLNPCIRQIRALDDDADKPRYIET
jgi:hypothetical protein